MGKKYGCLVEYNNKIRIKITDKCNLACPFCHSEGTKETEEISLNDKNFINWIRLLRPYFDKIHLTGGEPTLYKKLPLLCKFLKMEGYDVFLTTNLLLLNETFLKSLPYISKINVSLHTLNPEYFKLYVKNKDSSSNYLDIIKKNILELKKITPDISINTVISNDCNQQIDKLLYFCQKNNLPLKLVPDWRCLDDAKKFIVEFLEENGFKEKMRLIKMPGSNLRIFYSRDNYIVEFKNIKPYYLDFWCEGCKKRDVCIEKFSFLRLEGNPLRFKVCIDKPALKSNEFEKDFWPNFKKILLKYKK
ncbi:MAG: Radical SAM domain protein [Candidatus Moranbacteria bacterium GW2011_GWF2_34_56]|nr:MAG: Radical SAM domain protein [Candidatus Moranbacteria bacterium GW2011_GWF1_34_10]KKP65367.1 MAG: Radical SAM domain protein [Candidatus Moranbacteria bacterium GW2011_GWF2_34_56]HBI17442.1 hypothetical protein [Candidatus Moranbacteria bacterium]